MAGWTTLEIRKETQRLIRQYCFLHQIEMKEFIEMIAQERLSHFKKHLEELRKIRV